MHTKPKILFILKRSEDYNAELHSAIGLSTGLYNSAKFVNDMMVDNGFDSNLVVVTDNNDIDREVTKYKPDVVIIEALWVVPTKFTVLQKLHPDVTWLIRMHSETPFVAGEGMAMDWLGEYSNFKNVGIACNSPRFLTEIRSYLQFKHSWSIFDTENRVVYLPNYYPQDYKKKKLDHRKDTIDIGCFGAIRPLKNHLTQAIAAVRFAEYNGKKLNFHINSGRIEMKGQPVSNNLMGLFEQLSYRGHQLINHQWVPREQFLELCAQMDIGMQVSFSETFNIVGADFISQGVPLIGTKEIPWLDNWFAADPSDSNDIVRKLQSSYGFSGVNTWLNKRSLTKYTKLSQATWLDYFGY